jgi:hypothetical protein
VYLVRVIRQSLQARIGERHWQEMIVVGATATKHLDRPVDDLLRHRRASDLNKNDLKMLFRMLSIIQANVIEEDLTGRASSDPPVNPAARNPARYRLRAHSG